MMLKKCLLITVTCLTFLVLVACASQSTSQKASGQTDTYQISVAQLQEITLDQLNEKIAASEDFLVYLGRPTCDYCQVFVPKLAEACQNKSVTIYYVDSDKADGKAWDDFIAYFGIKTVPNFSFFSDKQMTDTLSKGSEATVEEIAAFLEKYGDKK